MLTPHFSLEDVRLANIKEFTQKKSADGADVNS